MPKIVRNPRLRDCIKLVDYKAYFKAGVERATEIAEWYETGELIVLTNYRFDAGRKLLANVNFPNGTKKLMLHTADNEHGEPPRDREWGTIADILGGDTDRLAAFRAAVGAANTELIRLAEGLFPRYAFTKRLCVYNMTEMLAINLHFDSPQHGDTDAHLRGFVNMDDFPRIWHISESLEAVARQFYEVSGVARTIEQHPREFTRAITRAAFGDRYDSGSRLWPKHSVAFRPGEVWFVNPNITAHEVIYGRRLLDAVFTFQEKDLLDQERFYPTIVRNLHRDFGSAMPAPIETA